MLMTSQHSKTRQITPLCPNINYILKNAYGKYSNAPCMCQTGKVGYKGDMDQTSMPKNIPTLAPKTLRIYTCHASQVNSRI